MTAPRSPPPRPAHASKPAVARLRRACLAFPEAVEKPSHGEPTWFAGKGKVFATLDDHHHGAGHLSVWLPLPFGAQETLVVEDPARFFRPPYVGGAGWVGVVLDGRPDWRRVERLLREAFLHVATPRLRELLTRGPPRRPAPAEARALSDLSGIGPAMLEDLRRLGVRDVTALARRDPAALHRELCDLTGVRQDHCVLDTFRCAVAQAKDPGLPSEQRRWWWWSRQRKAATAGRNLARSPRLPRIPFMIPWTTAAASVRNATGEPVSPTEALAMLEAFMAYGRPPAHGWLRACMPHEEPSRPETWGPRSPAEVDWSGFERRAR